MRNDRREDAVINSGLPFSFRRGGGRKFPSILDPTELDLESGLALFEAGLRVIDRGVSYTKEAYHEDIQCS